MKRFGVGKIGAADGVFEKSIAGKEVIFAIIKTDATGGVARGFDDGERFAADFDFVAPFNKAIDGWNFQSFLFQPMEGTLIG